MSTSPASAVRPRTARSGTRRSSPATDWTRPDDAPAGPAHYLGRYTDPLADVSGHDALAAVIAGAQNQFSGFTFRQTGAVDGHHDTARFTWELVADADGSAPVAGSAVIRLSEDSRIRTVSSCRRP